LGAFAISLKSLPLLGGWKRCCFDFVIRRFLHGVGRSRDFFEIAAATWGLGGVVKDCFATFTASEFRTGVPPCGSLRGRTPSGSLQGCIHGGAARRRAGSGLEVLGCALVPGRGCCLNSSHGVGRSRDFFEIAAAAWGLVGVAKDCCATFALSRFLRNRCRYLGAGRGCERLLRNFHRLPQGGAPVRGSRFWGVPWYRGGVVV
jgi:hypothetical protein